MTDETSADEPAGGDEPPPRLSTRRWAEVRECLVCSTVTVGGGRSPASFDKRATMIVAVAEVVRHFLRVEATRPKHADRMTELVAWCDLSDPEVLGKAKQFAEERDDVNPVFVYTVGVRNDAPHSQVASWTRECVLCRETYTCGISSRMRDDIDAVRGNLCAFASSSASSYQEFRPLTPLSELSSIVILVDHQRPHRDGRYEAIDGAHRIVALCCAGIQDVEAYVAHMQH